MDARPYAGHPPLRRRHPRCSAVAFAAVALLGVAAVAGAAAVAACVAAPSPGLPRSMVLRAQGRELEDAGSPPGLERRAATLAAAVGGAALGEGRGFKRQASAAEGQQASGPVLSFELDLQGDVGGTGLVKVRLHPEWAPLGCQRLRELVARGSFNDEGMRGGDPFIVWG